eukprot:CAMPEP_0198147642 /NCGR_PEP_ID=MMETSP1443-20131203/36916_1 /TAXON_ID=186043 /ORGANISM="Entomoneis sp., Strain CCMP2396" /LENGTH=391 /DNA_ID=CAMNT_0043812055 /DNA_START=92 /DNA_END=1267 /DNA_ORIENTATION=+
MPPVPTKTTSSNAKRQSSSRPQKRDDRPPREVIIKSATPGQRDIDNLLDTLLDNDCQSMVSSLGGVEETEVWVKHDLGKVMGDSDDSSQVKDEAAYGTSRIAAARERYRTRPSLACNQQHKGLIHLEEEENLVRGRLEEISLGEKSLVGSPHKPFEVIDIEKLVDKQREHASFYPDKNARTDDTSKTESGTDGSPHSHTIKPRNTYETENPDEDDSSDVETSDEQTMGTKDLLARVQDRLTIQKLHEEIERLKGVVDSKNAELELLAGQLRRAVETKCDLVLAHTELERHHENLLNGKDHEAHKLMKTNFCLMEGLADVEKELLNEIVRLQVEIQDTRKQHTQELHDWERMHKNEMLERDCEIARLKEEVRKLLLKSSSNSMPMHGQLVAF